MSYNLSDFIDTLLQEDKRVKTKIDTIISNLFSTYSFYPLIKEYLEKLRVNFYLKELEIKSLSRFKRYICKYKARLKLY